MTSGASQMGLATQRRRIESANDCDTPKSHTLATTRSAGFRDMISTLGLLRSRWMIFRLCRYLQPLHMSARMRSCRSSVSSRLECTKLYRLPCGTNSVTMEQGDREKPSSSRMLGCRSSVMMAISRRMLRNAASRSAMSLTPSSASSSSFFTATCLPSCHPRYTPTLFPSPTCSSRHNVEKLRAKWPTPTSMTSGTRVLRATSRMPRHLMYTSPSSTAFSHSSMGK
mmetsp:Transcript_11901/g.30076  ORF Transcript_11901/g.30076 Transcript_11901/m.30076 type:complete len:226 (+) Transcript_11901:1405-2082(+)